MNRKRDQIPSRNFDINRAGARVRLLENGAAAFIPCSQIIDNKERISASRELGTIQIDGHVEFKLGDVIEVTLIKVSIENRNIVAKPTQTFAPLPDSVETKVTDEVNMAGEAESSKKLSHQKKLTQHQKIRQPKYRQATHSKTEPLF